MLALFGKIKMGKNKYVSKLSRQLQAFYAGFALTSWKKKHASLLCNHVITKKQAGSQDRHNPKYRENHYKAIIITNKTTTMDSPPANPRLITEFMVTEYISMEKQGGYLPTPISVISQSTVWLILLLHHFKTWHWTLCSMCSVSDVANDLPSLE